MADETISVVYEHLGEIAGQSWYHETILYTNANGEQFIASAGPSLKPDALSTISDLSGSAGAGSGAASSFGAIRVTGLGSVASQSSENLNRWLGTPGNPNSSQVVATGADLSQQWNQIATAEQQISAANIPYYPLNQNSNSAANTALTAAGIAPPGAADIGIFGPHWSPAWTNILSIPSLPSHPFLVPLNPLNLLPGLRLPTNGPVLTPLLSSEISNDYSRAEADFNAYKTNDTYLRDAGFENVYDGKNVPDNGIPYVPPKKQNDGGFYIGPPRGGDGGGGSNGSGGSQGGNGGSDGVTTVRTTASKATGFQRALQGNNPQNLQNMTIDGSSATGLSMLAEIIEAPANAASSNGQEAIAQATRAKSEIITWEYLLTQGDYKYLAQFPVTIEVVVSLNGKGSIQFPQIFTQATGKNFSISTNDPGAYYLSFEVLGNGANSLPYYGTQFGQAHARPFYEKFASSTGDGVLQAELFVKFSLDTEISTAKDVGSAISYQAQNEIDAASANIQNAQVGSAIDNTAQQSAATTEAQWKVALQGVAWTETAFQAASASLRIAQDWLDVLHVYPSGQLFNNPVYTKVSNINTLLGRGINERFFFRWDALEAAAASHIQAAAASAFSDGTVALEYLISSVAEAWHVTDVTVALDGSTVNAAGGDLVIAGPHFAPPSSPNNAGAGVMSFGNEYISDGARPSIYAVLPSANPQIANFHSGTNGSLLDFLGDADLTGTISQNGADTKIVVGTSSVDLVGVGISSLSVRDNLAGFSSLVLNGDGYTLKFAPGGSYVDDGSTHVSVVSTSGHGDTIVGGNGAETLAVTDQGSGNTLVGGTGATTLLSNVGGNTLRAGTGFTLAAYDADGVTIDLAFGTATLGGIADQLVGISNVAVTGMNDTIVAGPGSNRIKLSNRSISTVSLANLGAGDEIDFASVGFDSSGKVELAAWNTLRVTESAQSYDLHFARTQSFADLTFNLSSDGTGGTAVNLTNGQVTTVGPAQTQNGLSVSAGATLEVQSGGITHGVALIGACEVVRSGGAASGTSVGSGSFQQVDAGGFASGTTIQSNGWEVVSGSAVAAVVGGFQHVLGSASGTTVQRGGEQDVYGNAIGTYVSSGGAIVVLSGAVANGATIQSGGVETVSGTDSASLINGSQTVFSGAIASSTIIATGGSQTIAAGGSAVSTTINSGGIQLDHGVANGGLINVGGFQDVSSGGVVSSAIVKGGFQAVSAGGRAVNTVVNSGGVQFVASGGVAVATTAASAGYALISDGAILSGAIISGGTLEIAAKGSFGSGGISFVGSGGVLRLDGTYLTQPVISGFTLGATIALPGLPFGNGGSATLLTGNVLQVWEGGTTYNLHLDPSQNLSGYVFVVSQDSAALSQVPGATGGGTRISLSAPPVVVSSGQIFSISGGQVISGAYVLGGGTEKVLSGGSANTTTVNSGAAMQVSAGGFASGTLISGGFDSPTGNATESVAGLDLGAIITAYGVQNVLSGGLASGATLSGASGGSQNVSSGGTTFGTTVNSPLFAQTVLAGGVANGTILNGGVEFLNSGGIASGTVIAFNGQLNVAGGAVAIGTVLTASGTAIVQPGGTINGAILSGGTLVLSSGAIANGIVFADGAALEVMGSSMPSAVLSGFGPKDTIDLANASFVSTGTVNLLAGNVLQVAEGGKSYNFNLDPSQNYAGLRFGLTSDGAGGTDVTAVSVVSSGQVSSVASGQYPTGTIVLPGGTLNVLSGGVAFSIVDSGGNVNILGGSTNGTRLLSGAQQTVTSAGLAISSIIGTGSQELLVSGGGESGAVVDSGGKLFVSSGSWLFGATVNSGGSVTLYDGASLTNSVIDNGTVTFALTTSKTWPSFQPPSGNGSLVLGGGGQLTVPAATSFTGSLVISGGSIELGSSGAGSSSIIFASSTTNNTLVVDGTAMPTSVIQGFAPGDRIDLANVNAFPLGTRLLAGNVLQVYSPVSSYNLHLDPSANYTGANFNLVPDGRLGTYVNFGSTTTLLSGQNVSGGSIASGSFIYDFGATTSLTIAGGGWQFIYSGGLATTTTLSGGEQDVYSGGVAESSIVLKGSIQDVYAGGSALGAVVSGVQSIQSGGVARSTVIRLSGHEYVYANGSAIGSVVSDGGRVDVFSAGNIATATVNSGGVVNLSSTGSALSTTVNNGGSEVVFFMGSALGAAINSGGVQLVSDGGKTSGTIINDGGTEIAVFAGSASSAVINSGGLQRVPDGGRADGTTIKSGGVQEIGGILNAYPDYSLLHNGLATSTTVNSGGVENVRSGGVAANAILQNGGVQNIYSGGAVTATTFVGGTQNVMSGATATGQNIVSGIQNVSSGGTVSATALGASGVVNVYAGANVVGTIFSGGTQNILPGATVASAAVSTGTQIVSSGAATTGTTIGSGGVECVLGGGLLLNAIATTGGLQQIQGGSASSTVLSGGNQRINSGFAVGTIVNSGSVEDVYALASNTVINSGGVQNLYAGGTVTGTVFAGGAQRVMAGAVVTGAKVASGNQDIASGGAASGTVLGALGVMNINAGANVVSTFFSGGTQNILSGAVLTAAVLSSGTQNVTSGATASATSVFVGGVQTVLSGQTIETMILSGGEERVSANALANRTTVSSGGILTISSGGIASAAIVTAGGTLRVQGGTASGTSVFGGTEEVSSGTDFGSVVASAGEQKVFASAVDTTIGAAGVQTIFAGQSIRTTIKNGGFELVSSGGTASGTTVLSGGYEYVYSGGVDVSATIDEGGVEVIVSGGQASSTLDNGTQIIGPALGFATGGTANDVVVGDGGQQFVNYSGTTNRTTVGSGGSQVVNSAGAALDTTIGDGGTQFVLKGASISGTHFSGGAQRILSGAIVQDTFVVSGAQYVSAGGLTRRTTVGTGAFEFVGSGATTESTVISGGTVEIGDGGSSAVSVTFVGQGGSLIIDGSSMTTATISGFDINDQIDLTSINYDGSAVFSVDASNVLHLTENGQTVDLRFSSSQNFMASQFTLRPDARGGTSIALGALSTVSSGQTISNTAVTSNTVQYVSGTTVSTTISSGGVQELFGTDFNGVVNDGGIQRVESGGTAGQTVLNDPGTQIVASGGLAVGVKVSGGLQHVFGTASASAIDNGGFQIVESGGTAIGTVIAANGRMNVYSAGSASGAVIDGGVAVVLGTASNSIVSSGALQIGSGGVARDSIISSGGLLAVAGTADGARVDPGASAFVFSGGILDVRSGNIVHDTTIFAGGSETVGSGGIDIGSIISGGLELIQSGGVASGATIAGGTLELAVGASIGNAPITFAASGSVLRFDGSVLSNTLAGFSTGDAVDLAGVALDSSGTIQLTPGNVLQIVENGATYRLQLEKAVDFSARHFQLRRNAGGGTLVGFENAPIVSAPNALATRNQSLAASSMFTVFDPDGDTITKYALWDTQGNGHWVVNGVAQATNVEIDISAAQLATTTYQSGSGTDQLYVRAFDGSLWSAWRAFTASAPLNLAPVVTAANAAVANGHSVSASSLFTASDPNGDTLTTFAFWDSTGSGHFQVNGASKNANIEIDVTAAQLAQTSYVAGSSTDQLYVRAFDGTSWSSWQAFTAGPTTPVAMASNTAIAAGQSVAASSFFIASDADGDAITKYAFWDSNTNGHFVVNGVSQGSNVEIDVMATQLVQTSYVAGNGIDQLYVRAFSGGQWGAWRAFTAGPTVPQVVATNAAIAAGRSRAASSLFTASDADGDVITKYALWDSNTNGHFVVNGVNQGGNVEIDVTSAQLSQTSYVAGSGTDQLYVRAFSGGQWGAWQAFTAGPVAPIVNASNLAVAHNQSLAASSMFTVFDPDGDAITKYALWDTQGNGHWVVNGVAQATNVEIDISAAQLATTAYQSGSGTDQLYVRACDGSLWSAWRAFTVSAPLNQAAIVTAANAAVANGHSVSASSLFTASDPNGDALTTFAFWNSTGSGHFQVNGASKNANIEIDVTAAQLAQTSYVAGSATDQLYVRAFDGTSWSSWQAFTAGPTTAVATASNAAIAAGQSVAVSSFFIASDADGDAITKYAFWDSNISGHFVVNGVGQGSGVEIDVTAAQLAQTSYVAGNGIDQLYVRALSGAQWGAWQAFKAGPLTLTLDVSNVAVASGQRVAASSLFSLPTAVNIGGETPTQYAFWDSGTNGYFTVDGVARESNVEIDITAAQLGQTSYVAGNGTDQLYVRAFNGSEWGAWQAFTAGPVAPIVSASNIATVPGQILAASKLVTASDPNGVGVTTYAFWSSNANSHFTVNGAAQAANAEIDVSASQLVNTYYVSGQGADQLYVRASNGNTWSNWQAFTATSSSPAIVQAGSSLELGSAYAGQVTFFGSTGTLRLDESSSFAGTVAGMVGQDAIDFADISFASSQAPVFHDATAAGGILTVTDGIHTASVALLGNYLTSTFVASNDGHGGTLIIDPPASFTPTIVHPA